MASLTITWFRSPKTNFFSWMLSIIERDLHHSEMQTWCMRNFMTGVILCVQQQTARICEMIPVSQDSFVPCKGSQIPDEQVLRRRSFGIHNHYAFWSFKTTRENWNLWQALKVDKWLVNLLRVKLHIRMLSRSWQAELFSCVLPLATHQYTHSTCCEVNQNVTLCVKLSQMSPCVQIKGGFVHTFWGC